MPAHIEREAPRVFFKQLVDRAVERERLAASEASNFYLVCLLEQFIRPEALWSRAGLAPDAPLTEIFYHALTAEGRRRRRLLQLAGDAALFAAGFFPDSLERRAISADYCVRLGSGAYGTLSTERERTTELFAELAERFARFVDVLNEVSLECSLTDDGNLLRLYDQWVENRSERSGRVLRERGLVFPAGRSDRVH